MNTTHYGQSLANDRNTLETTTLKLRTTCKHLGRGTHVFGISDEHGDEPVIFPEATMIALHKARETVFEVVDAEVGDTLEWTGKDGEVTRYRIADDKPMGWTRLVRL